MYYSLRGDLIHIGPRIAVIECNWQQGMQTQAPHDHGFRLALKALEKRR